jgi:hypothetical protein
MLIMVKFYFQLAFINKKMTPSMAVGLSWRWPTRCGILDFIVRLFGCGPTP